ncbi:MAG: hypothetical protein Q8R40_00460 [bacterium]|nr:hypothetical protein [bacterium]
MLHTNLLPDEEKQIVILEQWLRVITFLGLGTCGAFLIGITFLAPAYMPLYFQAKELDRSLTIQKELLKKMNDDKASDTAFQIKNIAASLEQASAKHSPGSLIFDAISPQRPGIVVTTLTVDKEGNIIISGKAATRQNLLGFEEHLRNSGFFQNIAVPLANIIRESDVNFTFRGKLKPSYFL